MAVVALHDSPGHTTQLLRALQGSCAGKTDQVSIAVSDFFQISREVTDLHAD